MHLLYHSLHLWKLYPLTAADLKPKTPKNSVILRVSYIYAFMHLADAFIQSDLQCIQVTVSTFLSGLAFPGNRTHDLGVANAMLHQLSYRKATVHLLVVILL